MGFKWPKGMDERPLLTKIEGRTVHFKDGSSKNFDAIILCTALPVPGR
jgi:trimethylamine monooxygenase